MTGTLPGQDQTRSGTRAMVAGSLIAALAAYVFLQGGARLLGAERFAAISALWTIQFLVMAVALTPLEQLTIRWRALRSGSSVVPGALVVISVAAAGAGLYSYVNVDSLFSGDNVFVLLTVLSVITLGLFALGRGELAGRLRYREYGLITGAQSVTRLIAGLAILAATDAAVGGGWAMALSPLLIVVWWPRGECLDSTRSPGNAGAFLTGAVVGNAAAQTILVAGPLAVEGLGGSAAEVSVLFVTLTLFRAPLAVANNLLARLLPPFSALAEAGNLAVLRSWGVRLAIGGSALAALSTVVGALVGPAVTSGLFGADFRPTTATAALVAGGSVLATVAAFSNQILLALGTTWRLAGAWIAALAVAIAVMAVMQSDPAVRVAAGFMAGEAVALLTVGLAAMATTRRPATAA